MTKPLFTERLSVGITPEMDRYLEDLARDRTRKGKTVNKSDLIREAIRFYMDNQEDLNGSRRQIAKSLDAKMQTLMTALNALQTEVHALRAQVGSHNQDFAKWECAIQPLIEWIEARRQPRK